jgi:hypothetical protein
MKKKKHFSGKWFIINDEAAYNRMIKFVKLKTQGMQNVQLGM